MYPILIQFGDWTLHSYEVFMWLGIALGWLLAERLAWRIGLNKNTYTAFLAFALIGGWLGARLLYVATKWDYYSEHLSLLFNFMNGGYVYYGGIFGAIFSVTLFLKIKNQPLAPYLDCAAPGLALGQAFARQGCYGAGCCFGKANETWGVVFSSHQHQIARLPTQLIESLFGLFMTWVLLKYFRCKKFDGELISIFLMSYAIFRFLIEFIRDDWQWLPLWGHLSVSQWISITTLALVGTFYVQNQKRHYSKA